MQPQGRLVATGKSQIHSGGKVYSSSLVLCISTCRLHMAVCGLDHL